MGRFKNKVAIVTGGANGIGFSVMSELLEEGAAVVFSDVGAPGIELTKLLKKHEYAVHFCKGNMRDQVFCRQIVDETISRFGNVDYLVNNAFSFVGEGLRATTEDWELSYSVGPIAYARMVQGR